MSEETKHEVTQSELAKKKKIIKGLSVVGGVVIGAVVLSNLVSFSSKSAVKHIAIASGEKALVKAKEVGKEKLASGKEKLADKLGNMDLSTPSNAGNKGNVIKNVESDKYVTLDNVALTSAQADIQLTNAIQAGDLDRTKYILDSGVNVAFTDDAICVTADTSGFHVAYQDMVMPKTMEDARQMLARFNGGIFITSSCSKLFLYRASLQLKKQFSEREYPYFNRALRPGDTERAKQEQAKRDEEKRREDIYNLILAKTPAKDLYQLPLIFTNADVPYVIRKEALTRYLNAGELPVTANRAAFLKAVDDASAYFLKEEPNDKRILANIDIRKNSWSSYMKIMSDQLLKHSSEYSRTVDSLKSRMSVDVKFQIDVANLQLPVFDVQSMTAGKIAYTENSNQALWYYGVGKAEGLIDKYDFQPLFVLNSDIDLIATIVGSKKVNLNYQDQLGNTMLHYISTNIMSFDDRSLAVLTRYLLNNGVNDKLLNKDGESAFMITQKNNLNSNDAWANLSKAYSDKNFN
ncbi:hypothetical protein MAFF241648_21190 [Ralstonia solanacearum]|nr:hypothetical protein MAFF241648_21190 [Ralstonia solanacearum]